MNYDEAVEAEVTRTEAMNEIEKHPPASWDEFVTEFGEHEVYIGGDVLGYLGY